MIITLLRKPLEGSVADNALKHGCGSINIDDTRIGNIVQDTSKNGRSSDKHKSTVFQSGLKEEFEGNITIGRWPANFILIHNEGCELKGTKKVKGVSASGGSSQSTFGSYREELKGKPRTTTGYADKDGKETVEDWGCVVNCPIQELDLQSGNRKTTWVSASHKNNRQGDFLGALGHPKDQGYNDDGGASRFFKQFKKEDN